MDDTRSVPTPGVTSRAFRGEHSLPGFVLLAIFIFCCGPALTDDVDRLRRTAVLASDNYQDCLVDQYEQVTRHRSMTEPQFVEHISLACIPIRERYRVAMLHLLACQFPMLRPEFHVDAANEAVAQMQKDIVRTYVRNDLHQD
jgi:hypothetical protein